MGIDDMVLDDEGLRKLLKLPADADLDYYRRNRRLPYSKFRVDGQDLYRYVTGEVIQWMIKRQRPRKAVGADA